MTFQITISTRTALMLLVLAVLAIPATAGATHLFNDVGDGHPHEAGIAFAKNSGVSIGCQDGTVYCPDDPVTRAQMGSFMYRLSGTDPATSPSVNADRVDGYHAGELIRVAFDRTDNAPDQDGNLVSADISVPADGFLIMAGGVQADGTGAHDGYTCRLTVDGTTVTGSIRASVVHFFGAGHTDNSQEDCSTTGAAPVTAGNLSVALNITGRDTTFFTEASMWALYVPFDGMGNPAG